MSKTRAWIRRTRNKAGDVLLDIFLSDVCQGVLFACYCPFAFCFLCFDDCFGGPISRTYQNRHRREAQKSRRPVAPPPRPRALTLPLVQPTKKQRTLDQLQSTFMKLPPELRRRVYSEVLGGAIVHLNTTTKGKPRTRLCFQSDCRCPVSYWYRHSLSESTFEFSLVILRTCRKM